MYPLKPWPPLAALATAKASRYTPRQSRDLVQIIKTPKIDSISQLRVIEKSLCHKSDAEPIRDLLLLHFMKNNSFTGIKLISLASQISETVKIQQKARGRETCSMVSPIKKAKTTKAALHLRVDFDPKRTSRGRLSLPCEWPHADTFAEFQFKFYDHQDSVAESEVLG